MTLAGDHVDLRVAPHRLVAAREFQRVRLEGDDLIRIPVNVEYRDLGVRQRRQAVDGIILPQVLRSSASLIP